MSHLELLFLAALGCCNCCRNTVSVLHDSGSYWSARKTVHETAGRGGHKYSVRTVKARLIENFVNVCLRVRVYGVSRNT